ncbi:MAG: M1 family metallopeptidase, partial [Deltaproteobacteria bacterium]
MLALVVAIGLASGSAGAVRVPSSDRAWGGIREEGPERVADYELEARLDPVLHTVEGRERLSWKNRSAEPISSLYVHLYLNAFEGPGSTFAQEKVRYGGFRFDVPTRKGEWGYIDLKQVTQSGKPVPWMFVHPDGGPETDRTVARLDLPEPVPPGGTAVLEMEFHDQLPRVVARTGWFDTYHLVAQWFPKVGVLELPGERGAKEPRWNCHEFHLHSEFYADFGSYRATLTVPRGYVVGSVGRQIAPPEETAQGVRYRIAQDDVDDFAFTAWNGFQSLEDDFRGQVGGPDVHIRVLHPREYAKAGRIALDATRDALAYFSRTLGPYPYGQVTVVVPPWNAIESGGMEYETFFTTVGALGPPLLDLVRFVTVHEFGHGYFMGLLASNEFEEPFLDEGLNEFWDARMLQ